jgi:hypothetical protein
MVRWNALIPIFIGTSPSQNQFETSCVRSTSHGHFMFPLAYQISTSFSDLLVLSQNCSSLSDNLISGSFGVYPSPEDSFWVDENHIYYHFDVLLLKMH